jgi:uncharacterized membrane protein YcaP (DUF421 family)
MIEIILRTTIIYFVVFIGIRLSGKREVGQMTPFDFVLLLLIASAVQNAMIGASTSLSGGVIAALTLFLINGLITMLAWKNKKVRHWIEGSPTILVENGVVLKENLLKEKIDEEMLEEALMEHDVEGISAVKTARLEIDGSISVIRKDGSHEMPHRHHRFRVFVRK